MKKEEALSDSSVEVIVVRHSILNQIPILLSFIAVTVVCTFLTIRFPSTLQEVVNIGGIDLKLPLFGIFPLVVLGLLIHRISNERLVFHPGYLLFREGIVSWRETSSRIEYQWIREVNIKQNLLQKILNIGELRVCTVATQQTAEVTMPGVRNPRKVKDEIYRRIDASQPFTTS